jgi:hypothetical protein
MSDSSSSPPVITLTAEQSQVLAAAKSAVEIRDHSGQTIGYLLHCPEITRFYTPAELGELQRLAALRAPGRTLEEIMEAVRARVQA